MHVMLDLETRGTRPGSIIRSIGAVVFMPETQKLGSEFYVNIEGNSCIEVGLTSDPETDKWWAGQDQAVKDALLVDQKPLKVALDLFHMWFDEVDGEKVWGHGASFDPVLLKAAYHAVGKEAPWKFWDERCCRTVLALGNRKPLRTHGAHHNAVSDAKNQAIAVMAALKQGIKL